MGVDYNAAIVVGAAWEDVTSMKDIEKIDDLIYHGDLHDFPPPLILTATEKGYLGCIL